MEADREKSEHWNGFVELESNLVKIVREGREKVGESGRAKLTHAGLGKIRAAREVAAVARGPSTAKRCHGRDVRARIGAPAQELGA